jgi:hypothetical protein
MDDLESQIEQFLLQIYTVRDSVVIGWLGIVMGVSTISGECKLLICALKKNNVTLFYQGKPVT